MSGAAAAPGQDPSMEDILASIRKILNEEEAAPAPPAAPAAAPAPVPAPVPIPAPSVEREAEPLELTEAMLVALPVEEIPEPPPPPPLPVAVPPPPRPAPAPAAPEPAPALLMDPEEGLVAPATAAAAASLIGQLARAVAAERIAPVHRGGPSIEDVVREEVRPLLKEWMDAHLPALVERLVRTEIERVVSRLPT